MWVSSTVCDGKSRSKRRISGSAARVSPTDTACTQIAGAAVRVNFIVTSSEDDAQAFLGPLAKEFLVFADPDRLDDDPWLLLRWRGRDRDELLAHLGPASGARAEVAPWWPLVPGAPLPVATASRNEGVTADPTAALTRLGPLDVAVRGRPVAELFPAAYLALVEGPDAAP